jgi:predicted helicase
MLMPYYIATMNIEHAYLEATGEYKPFQGICLVDTFELTEETQASLFTRENTRRVQRQKEAPIFVILGNPPYNVGQKDENDANRNRRYEVLDGRLAGTYGALSAASSTTKLADVYVKALRWASDRIGSEGMVALVTNNGFLHKRVFDGMRKSLSADFSAIYVLDLGGDVRENPKLSGTTHNVFGIQPGVSVNFFVRKLGRSSAIHYARLDEFWRKEEKLKFLDDRQVASQVSWDRIEPHQDGTWLDAGLVDDFSSLVPLTAPNQRIFHTHSMGVNTNRDAWTFSFKPSVLANNVQRLLATYNHERLRLQASKCSELDSFLISDPKKIKWSSSLKAMLKANVEGVLEPGDIRRADYRPFTRQYLYFNRLLTHRRARLPHLFPSAAKDGTNSVICVPGPGNRQLFSTFATKFIPALDFAFEKVQVFSFFVFDEDGSNQRENITDWALDQFRSHYQDKKITKWNVFHYVYGVLHHPVYRDRYAANLKRELPRIPFAPDFWAFAKAGERLAELHINYENQPEYPLERVESPNEQLDWRVTKMRLSKDKTILTYNDFLTLKGIPPEVFQYRLGNRSALEWVIDQYQVSTDKRSGITNDPNRPDDPQYILRLIGQVITVSLETVKLVNSLPELGIETKSAAGA